MSPSAAGCFIVQGLVLVRLVGGGARRWERGILIGLTGFIAVFGLLELLGFLIGVDLNLEDVVANRVAEASEVLAETMSPVAAGLVWIQGIGLVALLETQGKGKADGAGDLAGALGLAGSALALVFLLGYIYGAPLLYGNSLAAISLNSVLAGLLLAVGMMAAAGREHWPLRSLVGESARARLLRAFVPLTVVAILSVSVAQHRVPALENPTRHVLIGAFLAVAFAFLAGLVVSRVAHVLGETIDRAQKAQREAERARAQMAETLAREVSHRVKNNLAMAAGLLQIRMQGEQDPRVAEALRDTVAELHTFASIHDQMAETGSARVELLELLRRLAKRIQGVFRERSVEVAVEGDEMPCASRDATALSVIANELITNAIKHGEPDAEGRRRVKVRLARDGGVSLSVWNAGSPAAGDLEKGSQRGMGLSLVRNLVVEQYGGSFALEQRNGGTLARVDLGEACLRDSA